MAITYVAASFANSGSLSSDASPDITVNSGAGNNRMVAAFVIIRDSPGAVVTSATYGGQAMTQAGSNAVNGILKTAIYYILDAPSGSNTLTVNFDSGPQQCVVMGAAWAGVATTSALDQTNTGSATSDAPTIAITPTEGGEVVLGCIVHEYHVALTGTTWDVTTSPLVNSDNGAWVTSAAYMLQTTAATANVGWTANGSDIYAMSAATFKMASAGAALTAVDTDTGAPTTGTPVLSIEGSYWWNGDGAISSVNVLEHVESPSIGQAYTGTSVTAGNPWTIAFRGVPDLTDPLNQYVIDVQTGRVVLGTGGSGQNGFYTGAWTDISLLVDNTDDVFFLVSDGANIQAYRDNSAVSTATASTNGLGGTIRWLSHFDGVSSPWDGTAIAGAVYDIALDSDQRTALYNAMVGLTVDDLTAADTDTGAPTVGTPALSQAQALTATDTDTGAPTTGTPALGQAHALTAVDTDTDAPTVGTPALGQAHALSAVDTDTGAPTVGTPELTVAGAHTLTAVDTDTGAPTVSTPALGQVHALVAVDTDTGAPTTGTPELATAAEVYNLTANGVVTGVPVLAILALVQIHALSNVGVFTGTPVAGEPAIDYSLEAVYGRVSGPGGAGALFGAGGTGRIIGPASTGTLGD